MMNKYLKRKYIDLIKLYKIFDKSIDNITIIITEYYIKYIKKQLVENLFIIILTIIHMLYMKNILLTFFYNVDIPNFNKRTSKTNTLSKNFGINADNVIRTENNNGFIFNDEIIDIGRDLYLYGNLIINIR